jgi:hypothetical protein
LTLGNFFPRFLATNFALPRFLDFGGIVTLFEGFHFFRFSELFRLHLLGFSNILVVLRLLIKALPAHWPSATGWSPTDYRFIAVFLYYL